MSMNLYYQNGKVTKDFEFQTPTNLTMLVISLGTREKQVEAIEKYLVDLHVTKFNPYYDDGSRQFVTDMVTKIKHNLKQYQLIMM